MTKFQVPFFRPSLQEQEVAEVVETLRSGWLTSGPKVKRFETQFAAAISAGGKGKRVKGKEKRIHAIALNSGTAALHLAVEALRLKPDQGVLVPTMTFAATAEVVRYQQAIPILVDCDPVTLNMDLDDAAAKLQTAKRGGRKAVSANERAAGVRQSTRATDIVGIMPVHVGGVLMDLERLERFARQNDLWVVEDAAHAFPAGWSCADGSFKQRTNGAKSVTCYSFYANKTITTGEGGMAVTSNETLARRIRLMSLHGLSADAWNRFSTNGSWDYKIVAPGFKYNLTDIAAAIGIHQLGRAEVMRREREQIAKQYSEALATVEQIESPVADGRGINSWHLYAIKLRLNRLKIDRNRFIQELKQSGVGCSVHWRPLHLHPYYQKTFGYRAQDFPVATAQWKRLISLPIFPGMGDEEIDHVIRAVKRLSERHAR